MSDTVVIDLNRERNDARAFANWNVRIDYAQVWTALKERVDTTCRARVGDGFYEATCSERARGDGVRYYAVDWTELDAVEPLLREMRRLGVLERLLALPIKPCRAEMLLHDPDGDNAEVAR